MAIKALKSKRDLEDFTESQKQEIMKRDNYSCVFCGRGREHGVELQVDYIKPRDQGGKATIENGETLCAQHNFQKKNHRQTELVKDFSFNYVRQQKLTMIISWRIFVDKFLKSTRKTMLTAQIVWEKITKTR